MADVNNQNYWQQYETATGIKRPAWIDGVGNVNWSFGKKDPPPPEPLTYQQTAGLMPQVKPQQPAVDLMPQPQMIQPWRPGLRGWRPGW